LRERALRGLPRADRSATETRADLIGESLATLSPNSLVAADDSVLFRAWAARTYGLASES